jgi:glycosyltransferase involved in cell wall biosynthesis
MQLSRQTYLFVIPWSLEYLGGVNQVVMNLGRELQKSGIFEPVVLITDWNATEPILEEMHGLKTVRWRIRPWKPDMSIKERIAFWLWQLRFGSAFREFCLEHRVAVVNPHYAGPSTIGLVRIIMNMMNPIPFVISFHGTDVSSFRGTAATTRNEWQRFLRYADGVVVCSHDLGEKVRDIFGEEIRTTVVHNGLDADAFVEMASVGAANKGQRIILNVAKFEKQKGQDVLIKAFAAIAEDYLDVNLVLIGATDIALPNLRELCIGEGIANRVHFHPDVPHQEVADFLKHATIFILPSRQEAFGIVILEAGAFGLPVVASRVGGIPEILTDGWNGRLVPPDDPVKLAECLRSILDHPAESQEMGTRLRDQVRSTFTWSAACEKYVSIAVSRRSEPGASKPKNRRGRI